MWVCSCVGVGECARVERVGGWAGMWVGGGNACACEYVSACVHVRVCSVSVSVSVCTNAFSHKICAQEATPPGWEGLRKREDESLNSLREFEFVEADSNSRSERRSASTRVFLSPLASRRGERRSARAAVSPAAGASNERRAQARRAKAPPAFGSQPALFPSADCACSQPMP